MTENNDWHLVAKTDEVQVEEPKAVQVGNQYIAIYRVDGKFYATDDICTHEFASLSEGDIDGDEIECPLHQARFHLPTGKVRAAPATANLRTYPVKVTGDEIYIQISES